MTRLKPVTDSLEAWFRFMKAESRDLFMRLLKVNLFSWISLIIGILLAAGIVLAGASMTGSAGIVFIVVALVVFLIMLIFSSLISLASFRIVDEQYGAKRSISIADVVLEKAPPYIGFVIITLFLFAGGMVPFVLISLIFLDSAYYETVFDFLEAAMVLVALVMGFFLQFSMFELVIADRGVFESIHRSFSLARDNFMETLIVFLIRAGLSTIVSLPFTVLIILGGIIVGFGAAGALGTLPQGMLIAAMAIGAAIVILFTLAFMVVFTTLDETVTIPLTYRYWREIGKR